MCGQVDYWLTLATFRVLEGLILAIAILFCMMLAEAEFSSQEHHQSNESDIFFSWGIHMVFGCFLELYRYVLRLW